MFDNNEKTEVAKVTEQDQHEGRGRTSMGEVFARVHKVETELAEVREDIAGISVNLQGQGATLSRIANTLEQSRGTDWKALASWATVVLGITGLVASLVLAPMRAQMDANRQAIDRLADYRIVDTRNQLDDARRQVAEAEERGRYKERVDHLERELRGRSP